MSKKEWEEITKDTFDVVFKNSAITRTNLAGIKRNIDFLIK
jgi:epoxyqueuosine reductase